MRYLSILALAVSTTLHGQPVEVAVKSTPFDQSLRNALSDNYVTDHQYSGGKIDVMLAINAYVNDNTKYVADEHGYGAGDYWAKPSETAKNGGDCEDIAILKMKMLLNAGFDHDNIMIMIVRDLIRQAYHAVLLVKLDDVYLLDSASNKVYPATEAKDYVPIMSLNLTSKMIYGYKED